MKKRHYGKFYNKKLGMLRTGERVAVYAVITVLVLCFIIGASRIGGHSMEPTLQNGQPVVFARLHRNYRDGDIAAIRMPSDEMIVKRVVAVAGDTVDIKDGIVYINGTPENRSFGTTPVVKSSVVYPLTLKEGQIFVLGDNRAVSVDSRTFGPISTTQTKGRVLFVK